VHVCMCVHVCVCVAHARPCDWTRRRRGVHSHARRSRRRRRHIVIVRFVYYVQGLARGTADDDDDGRPVGADITCVRVPQPLTAVTSGAYRQVRVVLLGRRYYRYVQTDYHVYSWTI